ncbi:hypothetical protein AaE_012167 [Aphanomyces astaci]|uniref:Uncharacterized protein n=1 Tax=Aphanomyces astaci TaxID=112090 RepID=A0A6A4Z9R2_APHAT|nr:hypothetical protein AaE_012167 [Aphanomyces astaci]
MPKRRRGHGLTRSVKYFRNQRRGNNPASCASDQLAGPVDPLIQAPTACPDQSQPALLHPQTPTAVPNKAMPIPKHQEQSVTSEQRRVAWIVHFVDVLGSPPEHEWNVHRGTIHDMLVAFNLKEGMRVPMRNALLQFLASVQQGIAYTGSVSRPGGQNRVVELDSAESQIIADCMEMGWSVTQTSHMVNHYRSQQAKVSVGRSSVYSAYLRLKPRVSSMTASKQGSKVYNLHGQRLD